MNTDLSPEQDALFDYRLVCAVIVHDFGEHLWVDLDVKLPRHRDPLLIFGHSSTLSGRFPVRAAAAHRTT
jgi:hypothetical protein